MRFSFFTPVLACLALLPTVHAETAQLNTWPIATPSAREWDVAALQAIDDAMIGKELPGASSVLVIHDGKLVFERYFGDGGPDVLNDTRSATKTITALLVGAAVDRGLLPGAQARVYPYFTDVVRAQDIDPRKQDFSIEDLLTMSARWECDDENSFSSGNEERMYLSEDWPKFILQLPMRGYAPWQSRPADSPHGRTFSYCTGNPVVLGSLLERVSKQPLAAFSAEVLEHPLGIQNSQWKLTSDGTGMAGGGTLYRSRDLAKLGQLLLDGGRWRGRQVISSDWVKAMLTIHAKARDDADYGYLTWRFRFPWHGHDVAAWTMGGNGGNYVLVVPEARLVTVITRTSYNQGAAHGQSQRFFAERILKALR